MWHEDASAFQYVAETVVVGPSNSGDIYDVLLVASIDNGGTGYSPGDVLKLLGGVFSSAAILSVDTVGVGGAVTGISVSDGGIYTSIPSSPASTAYVTSGSGAGLTVTPTWENPGGPVQLCIADPSRIVLSIAVAQNNIAWYSTSRMTARNQGAIILPSVYNRPWLWTYPQDGVVCKLAWFAWCSVDNQAIDVLSVTMPNRICPTWRNRNRAAPSMPPYNLGANGNGSIQPGATQGVKSLLNSGWDFGNEGDRTEPQA